ncbi:MAG: class I SAM-dependent methyltransferase [Deltaproteobacteria bacterium]|nr:class I SAM-dependent methyltransferase [Candidatus Deferrimicrobiaceae bacterium]
MKSKIELTGKIEPFDTFWEAPEDIERGFDRFHQFYHCNYSRYLPGNRDAKILVVSCGYGYFVRLLKTAGYTDVLGIDSDPRKVEIAANKGLNCRTETAFEHLEDHRETYDAIVAEQEINHLTKEEILRFLGLCRESLRKEGSLLIHSLNGANPITGAEALAQNFDHYNTFTEYSLRQVLEHSGFRDVKVFPLNLYVFYSNPLNYAALLADRINTLIFRIQFILYGKSNRIFTKKIAASGRKSGESG